MDSNIKVTKKIQLFLNFKACVMNKACIYLSFMGHQLDGLNFVQD